MTPARKYVLDTNVFNHTLDGKVSATLFKGSHVMVTAVQAAELRATGNEERRHSLLMVFEDVAPLPLATSSFAFDVEGAGFDQACLNDGTGRFEKMLDKLQALDGRKGRSLNQTRDILIAETALKNDSILVSGDVNLREVIREFGGRAITLEELQCRKL